MNEVYIAAIARTPIGKFLGALSRLPATELGALAIAEAVRRAAIAPDQVQDVLMGCVLQAGLGQAPARQAAIRAGIPSSVPATTINMVCGSGLRAAMIAAGSIRAGENDAVLAGGMESMSNAPYLIPEARRGARLGPANLIDSIIQDGLWDVYGNFHMGETAELVCDRYGVTREESDAWALRSHQRAAAATKSGSFREEIVPIEVTLPKKEKTLVAADEGIREDSTLEALAKLPPVFRKDGRVTAGNASQISDAAAALLLVSDRFAAKHRTPRLARVLGWAMGGVEPRWVMMAPVDALRNLEARTGLRPQDMDLLELNEAFAAQTVALVRELKIDPDRVNVDGGAVALGHPIGCSGARVLVTLVRALRQRNLKRGMAALCLGGGNAVAIAVEVL